MTQASMEPRQQWRGNFYARRRCARIFRGFNGAAPTMARKLVEASKHSERRTGLQWSRANNGAETRSHAERERQWIRFNGAAPTMARKPRERSKLNGSYELLQWSRANNGAETARLADRFGVDQSLQWSRANNGAETPSSATRCLPANCGAVFERCEKRCQKQATGSSERACLSEKDRFSKSCERCPGFPYH